MMAKREAGELKGLISDDWLNKMADGLQEWVTQAEQKTLVWGYFRFCKPMLLRDGKDASAPRYRALPALPPTAIKAAIVSAAGRLGELDTRAGPGCLISMGKLSIVAHLLVQLHSAGIERVLVQCGYMGQKIEDSIRRTLPSEVYKKLEVCARGTRCGHGAVGGSSGQGLVALPQRGLRLTTGRAMATAETRRPRLYPDGICPPWYGRGGGGLCQGTSSWENFVFQFGVEIFPTKFSAQSGAIPAALCIRSRR